jgi:hypothetical protein
MDCESKTDTSGAFLALQRLEAETIFYLLCVFKRPVSSGMSRSAETKAERTQELMLKTATAIALAKITETRQVMYSKHNIAARSRSQCYRGK